MSKISLSTWDLEVDKVVRVGADGPLDKTDGNIDRAWRKSLKDSFIHVEHRATAEEAEAAVSAVKVLTPLSGAAAIKKIAQDANFDTGDVDAAGPWGAQKLEIKAALKKLMSLIQSGGTGGTTTGGDADTLGGLSGAHYLNRVNHTGLQSIATVDGLTEELLNKSDSSHGHSLATDLVDGFMSKEDKTWRNKFTEDASGNPHYSSLKILRTGDAPGIDAETLAAMLVGQSNLVTVTKQSDGSAKYSAGVEQVDKLAASSMQALLQDSAAGWVGQNIVLNGTNDNGELGQNSQEFYYKRRWYLCKTHSPTSATWERNSTVSMLDSTDTHDTAIINELLAETGWSNNVKTVATKSVKGDEYTTDTGYYYTCFSDDNKWKRVGEPATTDFYIVNEGNWTSLVTALTGHDFALSSYDAIGLTAGYRGEQAQRYYHEATRAIYECVISNATKVIWEKIR